VILLIKYLDLKGTEVVNQKGTMTGIIQDCIIDFSNKRICAAILKKKSHFRTFSDLVWNEVSKTYSLPKEFTASDFREFLLDKGFIHGSEKMWNVHKTVAGDLRFYWTEKNSKVTIN
jgi:sporulation protein YlmC with PRC-barrel domain